MAGNGRKMVEKWSKIDFRGYLVENGFSRVFRHFPTTALNTAFLIYSIFFDHTKKTSYVRDPTIRCTPQHIKDV